VRGHDLAGTRNPVGCDEAEGKCHQRDRAVPRRAS
jgi:hypothetical protein